MKAQHCPPLSVSPEPEFPSGERRRFLQVSAAVGLGLAAGSGWAQARDTLRLGQSTALTGPQSELGLANHEGAKACFAALNAKGGINGMKIELVARDDGYDARRAAANVEAFIADPGIFALINCFGTPMVEASLPLVRASGIPYFAPFTGAMLARPKDMRNVFNVRASYPEEAEQLVAHLTLGMRRIAVLYQRNSFGMEVFEGVKDSLAKRKLSPVSFATIENDGSDADSSTRKVLSDDPEAVVLALAGKPVAPAIRTLRAAKPGLPLYALSVMGSAATVTALGDDATGLTVSQIVPMPTNPVRPVVHDFLQDWRALGTALPPSHVALEGYINARVFIEALKLTGRNLTRTAFIDSVWNMKKVDLGGFEINFSEPGRGASRFVELTMVARGGKFIR
ncbi:ABC transporter substrate-binding protein [Caldimonas tepidiphila]|uniref:ABC transporter substrate-binding protein n=1 Tax=Caldimonas tepidiphila TaxID=2315841 RepID=UPI000E5B7C86|nr:ABC transporter substrate-binding protein [Caldimonas tepidiphila]